MAIIWYSPTGVSSYNNYFNNPSNAIDNNDTTYAYDYRGFSSSYTTWLSVSFSETTINAIKVKIRTPSGYTFKLCNGYKGGSVLYSGVPDNLTMTTVWTGSTTSSRLTMWWEYSDYKGANYLIYEVYYGINEGWSGKFNTATIGKWNDTEISKWNGVE